MYLENKKYISDTLLKQIVIQPGILHFVRDLIEVELLLHVHGIFVYMYCWHLFLKSIS